ncbi:DegT/DnrJ/EryC1/StrS family aminotransferase [Streptomyces sp. 549]|uniref:DegT/DnrJ/EryC1/StrS family aminotransferase n=1 Tax=Streptomyces sp. 549 TaxID=3049076 RepID=UPI0024C3C5FB|nr:DegT/DnrJ/EryC1/StrS family aminotransferase [Streptomyces sp. 549]MDK1476411.1 DegT/DnrJ/EryC1/StrS family aminotransferase [Streptomyces sp. 549]
MGTTELTAAGVKSGDEVIVPSFGGEHAAQAVRDVGATPVFVDIDRASYCLAPHAVEAAVTERTTAVVPVHLFGHPADMVCLHALAERHGLRLVETGEPLGRVSDAAARRRQHAAAYLDVRLRGVLTPTVAQGVEHTYEQYVVRVPGNGRPDRDAFRYALLARGVVSRIPIPTPAHRTHDFRSELWLPETERAAAETLALPVHEDITRRELQRIVSACRALGGLLLEAA